MRGMRLGACLLALSGAPTRLSAQTVDEIALQVQHPLDEYCANSNKRCFLNFVSTEHKIWVNGDEFRIKGINWYGSESRTGPPEGLDEHTVEYYMDFLSRNGFNAIRLLFNHESVIINSAMDLKVVGKAMELVGMKYLDM